MFNKKKYAMEYKELYLIRFSNMGRYIAMYTHVKDNVYMDTTCRGHENCLISVKEEDGKIVFDKAENESAKEYIYYHEGNGEFYTSKENAKLALFHEAKEKYESYITRTKKEIEEAKVNVLSRKLKVNLIENIEDIDFEQILYAVENENIFPIVVTRKVLTKEGVIRIEGHIVDKDYMEFHLGKSDLANVYFIDDEDSEYIMYFVFPTQKSAENYIKNEKSAAAAEKISNLEKHLNSYEEELKEINYKIENKLFD